MCVYMCSCVDLGTEGVCVHVYVCVYMLAYN